MIAESELILNPDGSVYHLHLLPEEIAETIITVGDPDRVSEVSKYFDSIEVKRNKREFVTHTGYVGNLKSTNFEKLLAEHPERPIRLAVKGMLPRGPLGREMLKKLKIYEGTEHPHAAQMPQVLDI